MMMSAASDLEPGGRPTWDRVWMDMAEAVGKRSRCARASIGCILVSPDNQVVSASYVGPPPNFGPSELSNRTCLDWCIRSQTQSLRLDPAYQDCVSSHAEMNAVARADFSRLQGGTAYVNGSVCWTCSKLLAASGVARVVMIVRAGDAHRRPSVSIDYLKQCGIRVDTMNPEEY